MKIIYFILSKWHLYRGVKFHHPIKRYHFERYEHFNQLRRGEIPRIPRKRLYKWKGTPQVKPLNNEDMKASQAFINRAMRED